MAAGQLRRRTGEGQSAAKPRRHVGRVRRASGPTPRRPACADSDRCLRLRRIRFAALGRLG
jgi:hypothetical protein